MQRTKPVHASPHSTEHDASNRRMGNTQVLRMCVLTDLPGSPPTDPLRELDLAFLFMPSDLALKTMNRVHRIVLGATGGRLGWSASGMPVIELTTTGRRSGQPRTTMLTSPYQEGSTIVVVASRGGDDHHPAWYLNLRDDPEVTVSVGG